MTAAQHSQEGSARPIHFAALLMANVALALGPWFVRLADTGPVSAGFWRLLLPLPLFVWLAHRECKEGSTIKMPPRRMALVVIAAGAFFALDLASWHIGIGLTRLGNATLFGNSGSIILMVWGLIALRRLPRVPEWLSVLCAVVGAAILMGRSLEISLDTLVGDLFCLLAGLFYAFYLLPTQKARETLGPWTVLTLAGLAGVPVLLAIALLLGEPVLPHVWLPVIALAVSSQIVGQGLLVFSLKNFPPLVIGLALMTQPAIGALVGWLAFGEQVGALDAAGMVLVGIALVLSRSAGRKRA